MCKEGRKVYTMMIKKLVNIPEDLYKKLEERAEKEEVNLSVIIRDALFIYLNPSKVHLNSSKKDENLAKNELNLAKKEEKVAENKPKRILKKK